MIDFKRELARAKSVSSIFRLVKSAAWDTLHQSRSGLELGLVNLENRGNEFLGAFHPIDSNIIIVNQLPLERIAYLDKELYNAYLFHILLYEYIRSMGYHNEHRRKELVIVISERIFGKHIVTEMSHDIKRFFPNIVYPQEAPRTPLRPRIIKEFDNWATNYIG